MPLYDCMLLAKPLVTNEGKEALANLVQRVGKHVCRRNGVVTDVKSFGLVQLGYGIKKLDGKYYQGVLMQMTMMATPNMNKELHYLNKDDRLLRWLLVKHRNTTYGEESYSGEDMRNEMLKFQGGSIFNMSDEDDDDDDDDEIATEEEDDAYDVDQERKQRDV